MMAKTFSEQEIAVLLDVICHGRPYSPDEVWRWMEKDDIESLKKGDLTIFNVALCLDSLQKHGGKLDPSGHQMVMPDIDFVGLKDQDLGGMSMS